MCRPLEKRLGQGRRSPSHQGEKRKHVSRGGRRKKAPNHYNAQKQPRGVLGGEDGVVFQTDIMGGISLSKRAGGKTNYRGRKK